MITVLLVIACVISVMVYIRVCAVERILKAADPRTFDGRKILQVTHYKQSDAQESVTLSISPMRTTSHFYLIETDGRNPQPTVMFTGNEE